MKDIINEIWWNFPESILDPTEPQVNKFKIIFYKRCNNLTDFIRLLPGRCKGSKNYPFNKPNR